MSAAHSAAGADATDGVPSNADRTALRPEHDALAHDLHEALAATLDRAREGRRTVIGVAGESGSGKSLTATNLARTLTASGLPTMVIHQDDYFLRPPRTNHEHRLQDLGAVGPHEVNLARIAEHVTAFREGAAAIEAPLVDYAGNRFVTQRRELAGMRVLVVEGTYALHLDDLDARVFLRATHEETAARRAARARDRHEPIIDVILGIEHRLIAPQGARADVVIDRGFRIVRRPAALAVARPADADRPA